MMLRSVDEQMYFMDLLSFFQQKENTNLIKEVDQKAELILSGVGNYTTKAFVIADFFRLQNESTVVLVKDLDEQKHLLEALQFWIQDRKSIYNLELIEEIEDYQKIECLHTIQTKKVLCLMTQDAYYSSFPTEKEIAEKSIVVNKDQDFLSVEIFNALIQNGYEVSHDVFLHKGEYRRAGGVLDIFPINSETPKKIEIDFDKVVNIWDYDQEKKQVGKKLKHVEIFPLMYEDKRYSFLQALTTKPLFFLDEIDDEAEVLEELEDKNMKRVVFTSFPQTDKNYVHLRYLSVLKFYNLTDFLNDIREKIGREWSVFVFTKRADEIKNIFLEEKIPFEYQEKKSKRGVRIINAQSFDTIPSSFQNPIHKIQFITDREIFSLKRAYKNKSLKKVNLEFLSSLKAGDFVVHFDHGIGRFLGIVQRSIDNIAREYLEVSYAENDKLFVPIDQADKVTKHISAEEAEDNEPRLSRLGSQEWKNLTKKIKKETEKIAKELLLLYADRASAKGFVYEQDNDKQKEFEKAFPYEETPGQIKAIQDLKKDMEGPQPMDRLVCGDVGFGKTEVAMRAAFKAVMSNKQVAFISPITILADQHYKSCKKRMEKFGVRVEMLSRFRTAAEQKKILKKLRTGDIDVIIGTHRLLQPDIKFFDLGLVIIDEEQKFGVKQKEVLKSMRTSVDILTLTATPIPRTLNLSLNKLRDITIITTPPPGRLPVITEVRKFGDHLIREAIMQELDRGGQVYFLHNRVESIEGIAQKLRYLVPEARFIVAHGQLKPQELESRIMEFSDHKYDVLVSSTIVENGIDLPNANTLIVNNAERFGLSQLYQLRGRIGRGKAQAYAYFLYNTQKLKDDAKKRLKAIVEASELGSGFQIAMRDLEIRGAGEILGANQHGTMNVVGVGHFMRLLNQTIEELKSGKKKKGMDADQDITIELPVEAYIPNDYIDDQKEKISVYQKLSAIDNHELLEELFFDIAEEFGEMPPQVKALFQVLDLKLYARQAGITQIKTESSIKQKSIKMTLSDTVTPKSIMGVLDCNEKWKITGTHLIIKIQDLGIQWLEGLQECVQAMAEAATENR